MAKLNKAQEMAQRFMSGGKLKAAQGGRRSNYPKHGLYAVRIKRCLFNENRHGTPRFIVEYQVIHAFDNDEGDGHRVGEEVGHIIPTGKDSFLKNVKNFLVGATGAEPEDVDKDAFLLVIDDDQPLSGAVLEMSGRALPIQEGKDKPFVVVDYIREIPARELGDLLTEAEVKRFYTDKEVGDLLEEMIDEEAAEDEDEE